MEIASIQIKYDRSMNCDPQPDWDQVLSSFSKSRNIMNWIPYVDHEDFQNLIHQDKTFIWTLILESTWATRYYYMEIKPKTRVIEIVPLINLKDYQEKLLIDYKIPSIKKTLSAFLHDFNNHLTVLLPNVEAALMFVQPENKGHKYINSAYQGIEGLNKYAQLIMKISRSPKAMLKYFHYEKQLNEALKSVREKFQNVSIQVFSEGDCRIAFFEEFFHEVIHCLIQNVSENADKDSVTLKIFPFEQKVGHQLPYYSLERGKYLCMAFYQTKPGPSFETITRMFDPFFTTRSKGKDQGVGLTISKNMMESAGGTLTFDQTSESFVFKLIFQRTEEE